MRKSLALFIVVASSALGACVPSVYPLYTDKDLRFDPGLVGVWSDDKEPDEAWTFTKVNDTSYELVIKDEAKSAPFDAHLVQIGKYRFLDIAPAEGGLENVPVPDIYKAGLIRGHMFLKVTSIEPALRMAFMDRKWLNNYLDAHPKELAYSGDAEDNLVLLAPTRDLQRFMLKHADDKGLFGDSSNLHKIK